MFYTLSYYFFSFRICSYKLETVILFNAFLRKYIEFLEQFLLIFKHLILTFNLNLILT